MLIERMPYGEAVTWCHPVVVTGKQNGSPRRNVDISPLNQHCARETFSSESPFHLSRRMPGQSWKPVTHAWNGSHSVSLRHSDRHPRTFITPFDSWRYTRAPQCFLSSGDGYIRRFDEIIATFQRKERCIDDTMHWYVELLNHWRRPIDYTIPVGRAGVNLNPDKFQFAQCTGDFAGFRISNATMEPLPKYLDAILDFPTPISTTDVRSWFGLVNKVTKYAQLRDIMRPFKPFLSRKKPFRWSVDLESAFQASKSSIIEAISHGVDIFDLRKRRAFDLIGQLYP